MERLVGQLTLEKEALKKALKHTPEKAETRENCFSVTSPGSKESKGGVSSLIFLGVASIIHRKRKCLLSKSIRGLSRDGLKPSVWNSLVMAIEG
jgi:hypothetical protein